MRLNRTKILIVVCVFWCNAHAAFAENAVDLFNRVASQWIECYLANDLDGLMELYTNDATVMLHGKTAMQGKSEIRSFFAKNLGTAEVTFEIDIEQAEIHGSIAYLVSKYWMSVKPHGSEQLLTDVGRSLLIYKLNDNGKWKIHADIDQATPDVSWPR